MCAITVATAVIQLQGIIVRQSHNAADGSIFERAFAATSVFYSWAKGPQYPGMWIAIAIGVPTLAFAVWYFWQNWQLGQRAFIYFVAYGGLVLVAGCLHVDASLHDQRFLLGLSQTELLREILTSTDCARRGPGMRDGVEEN
ncbi:hypothetical protein HAP41_0000016625 [Bradyrhizobium barranii subsp. apii]|uniref:Uncharacterized protein n=1 Tax=Bradyrhizobium barranii subsp. apii TaxID=2819348 RepID=A0A8T5VQ45_9BRAD|nr:hypothetical protein [Bradyrhizobium barranii]UPT90409.1 hypothetical protein HAP41_0000016625 [Bradyrhizobium barranii subsp. apii]